MPCHAHEDEPVRAAGAAAVVPSWDGWVESSFQCSSMPGFPGVSKIQGENVTEGVPVNQGMGKVDLLEGCMEPGQNEVRSLPLSTRFSPE